MDWDNISFKGGSQEALMDICALIRKQLGDTEDCRSLQDHYWNKWYEDNK